MKIQVFWDVWLCHWVKNSWHFEESYYLHLHSVLGLLDPRDEGITVRWNVRTLYLSQCHILEDLNVQRHCCKVLISHYHACWFQLILLNNTFRAGGSSFEQDILLFVLEGLIWNNVLSKWLHKRFDMKEVMPIIFKQPGLYLHFSTWFMENVLFEQKKIKLWNGILWKIQ
jgi:hypothetical protein